MRKFKKTLNVHADEMLLKLCVLINFPNIVLNLNLKILPSINSSLISGATSEAILKNVKLYKVHHHHLKIK